MSDGALVLRDARPDEAGLLTSLAMRSKAYWGYPPEFMEACRAELTVTPAELGHGGARRVVAELAARVAGFYALDRAPDGGFELEALFVDPPWMGRRIGRALVEHALAAVAAAGGDGLHVQGDPHAEGFYRAVGGVPAGSRESGSIRGRILPLFTIPATGMGSVPGVAGGNAL